MIAVRFEVSNESLQVAGSLALGNIFVEGPNGSIDSREKSVMIFTSIALLLDGLRKFLGSSRIHKYEFVGVDSSFKLCFKREKTDRIQVLHNNIILAEITRSELVGAVNTGVKEFLSIDTMDMRTVMCSEEPSVIDVREALSAFAEIKQI